MREYGANVAADWRLQPNPPTHDQPHTRAAYARWLPPNTPGRCRQLKARLPHYPRLWPRGPCHQPSAASAITG